MDLKDLKIKKLLEKLTGQKNFSKFAVVLGFSGVFLIFASSVFPKNCKNFETKGNFKVATEQKREKLEKNLGAVISAIKGAGNPKILITLESSTQTIYATEEKSGSEASEDKSSAGQVTKKRETSDCEKKLITVKDSAGTEHALAVTEIEPKVKGVVVICPGGENTVIKKRITEVVTAALNIPSSRVCVTKSG